MDSGRIKIIECFNISGMGLMTAIQHFEDGIPPNTEVNNSLTNESWIIKKRVLTGSLMVEESEIYFECETDFMHISHSFRNENDRQKSVARELEKRKNGIYWYLLAAEKKNQREKPGNGDILNIKSNDL